MEGSKIKETNCKNCNKKSTLNVNKVYAKESKLILILSGVIFLVGTFIGLYFMMKMISEMKTVIGIFIIASGLLIPVWVYNIFTKEDRNRVKAFNQTYIAE